MKAQPQETRPARVSRKERTKQAGEVRARWAWAEPAVWTERMLTALEQGVKGDVWFSLIDKVYSLSNLESAHARVQANRGAAGCDHQTLEMFAKRSEANLKNYFDTIPHQPLMAALKRKIADGRVLDLIESYLTQDVMDGLEVWTPTAGRPQGAVISPLLSNVYLDPLDRPMAALGYEMVRYADDFVILCRSRAEAEAALEQVRAWTAEAGLTLHPHKTRIADANQEGFDLLGYHFERDRRWPRDKSLKKFKDAVRSATPRLSGRSLEEIITRLNWTTTGWFEYFKHTSYTSVFRGLDGMIRRRLRRILLQRHRKRRRDGKGRAHFRWPNAFFAEHGLSSMEIAHIRLRQSVTR